MSDTQERINFDGQLTGEVAQRVRMFADYAGRTPQALIREILADALSDRYDMDASGSVTVESLTALVDAVGVSIPRPTRSADVLIGRDLLPE